MGNSHFLVFVEGDVCIKYGNNEWLFFDSMSQECVTAQNLKLPRIFHEFKIQSQEQRMDNMHVRMSYSHVDLAFSSLSDYSTC